MPADVRISRSEGLKVESSNLTGTNIEEPRPTRTAPEKDIKDPVHAHNMAYYTDNAVTGSGIGIVTATGDRTLAGLSGKLKVPNLDLRLAPPIKQLISVLKSNHRLLVKVPDACLTLYNLNIFLANVNILANTTASIVESFYVGRKYCETLADPEDKSWVMLHTIASLANTCLIDSEHQIFGKRTVDIKLLTFLNSKRSCKRARKGWTQKDGRIVYYVFENAKEHPSQEFHVLRNDPMTILDRCSSYFEGKEKKLTDEVIQEIKRYALGQAEKGRINVGFAYQQLPKGTNINDNQKAYCFLGFLSLSFPIREGLRQTLVAARENGLILGLFGGYDKSTIRAIAKNIGVETVEDLKSGPGKALVINQKEITDKNAKELVRFPLIFFARAPWLSWQFIALLQKQKVKGKHALIGYAGDYMEDVPAIRVSDVGIGIPGGSFTALASSSFVSYDRSLNDIVSGFTIVKQKRPKSSWVSKKNS